MPQLTLRQVQALKLIADGLSIDQVADEMFISRSGAEKLLGGVRKRLSARTLAQSVAIAINQGLILLLLFSAITGSVDIQRVRTRTRTRSGRKELYANPQYPEII